MCGRYALALSNEEVYDALENQLPRMFDRGRPQWERPQDYRPNYNMAPRQRAPVIRRDQDSNQPMLETMQWGLVPHWSKHPPTGPLNTINARSEALLDPSSGGMWHALKGYKRCIVPAQGYYEWLKKPPAKIAHFTRLPLTPKCTNASPPLMFFAGLWDSVTYQSPVESRFKPSSDPEDTREPYPTGNPVPLATFTILTTAPAKDIMWLHDRMPCVLTGWEEVSRWLDLGEVKGWEDGKGGTGDLLRGTPGLDCFPVPPEVGKIGNNWPTFIQPVSERSDGIKSFFQKHQPSPAKKGEKPTSPERPVKDAKIEVPKDKRPKEEIKEAAEGIDTEVTAQDDEKGLGDDSNAPNPDATAEEKPSTRDEIGGKRKQDDVAVEAEEDDEEKKPEKRGGHQTKVVRRTASDDGNKAQPAITNFFKSPEKVKAEPPVTKRTSARKGKK